MVLRGIFTLRRSELLFFYQDGASHLFPDLFDVYKNFIPQEEHSDFMTAYHKRLTGDDEKVKLEAAKHWSRWENGTAKFYIDEEAIAKSDDEKVSDDT
jgi:proline iminopeptidase